MLGGENKYILGGGVGDSADRSGGVVCAGQKCHRLAIGIIPAFGEGTDHPGMRVLGHTLATSEGTISTATGTEVRRLKHEPGQRETMTDPGDDPEPTGTDAGEGRNDRQDQTDSRRSQNSGSNSPSLESGGRVRTRVQDRNQPGQARSEKDTGGDSWLLFGRDLIVSIAIVLLFGGYLFAISGVWPPMVAVESGSMEPNLERTDLVFVMDTDRFQPDDAVADTGVVVARDGATTGYEQFGNPGDVIVFEPNGDADQTPIIHRAIFWVEEGEDWIERADDRFLRGTDSCAAVAGCPAPHDGFITKGDNNQAYDQVGAGRISQPVRPAWVIGTAELRVPGAGWVRLQFG